jgi:hypothetical protein
MLLRSNKITASLHIHIYNTYKVQSGSGKIALPFFNLSTRWVCGQSHTPEVCPRGNRISTQCRGGWVGPTAGLEGEENLVPTGIRSPVP